MKNHSQVAHNLSEAETRRHRVFCFLCNTVMSLVCLAFGISFASCDNSVNGDLIWDLAPIIISVQVVDADGNSVLTDETASHITATYRGETYVCNQAPDPRMYMPFFYGLKHEGDYLHFGELERSTNYTDEQLIIDFGDGSTPDVITMNHSFRWKANGSPKSSTSFKLNGKNVSGEIIIHKALNY